MPAFERRLSAVAELLFPFPANSGLTEFFSRPAICRSGSGNLPCNITWPLGAVAPLDGAIVIENEIRMEPFGGGSSVEALVDAASELCCLRRRHVFEHPPRTQTWPVGGAGRARKRVTARRIFSLIRYRPIRDLARIG